MGDGIFALCLVAFMFFYFKKKKAGFALLYSLLIAGFAIQLTKNLAHLAGPKIYFEAGTNLNFTNGGSVTEIPGFPSGHTAIAFALATVLVLLFKRKNMQLPLLLGAVLLGYSRMYLAQHFLTDIITGALLGTISGVLSFYLVQNSISIKRPFKNIYQASSRPESSPGTMQTA
jgi:membrane-associated phospholipid phosphatase